MKRIAIAFATVSTTAFATSQTDVVAANESEKFKVECRTNDGTIVHLVVSIRSIPRRGHSCGLGRGSRLGSVL